MTDPTTGTQVSTPPGAAPAANPTDPTDPAAQLEGLLRDILAAGLAEHFVTWHRLDRPDGPPGEWRCSCGEKFGFSDTAIRHVSSMLAANAATTMVEKVAEGYARAVEDVTGLPWDHTADSYPNPYLPATGTVEGADDDRCGSCWTCIGNRRTASGQPLAATRMIVCTKCGNKRCPHGTYHGNACTGSNQPGQDGSRYA